MDNVEQSIRNQRRPKGFVSSISTNFIHLRNPWVTAWWSCALPGLGQIILGSYVKGFLFITWELVINVNAKVNVAIMLSFNGRFEEAKNVLDKRWLFFYAGVYIYAIWDSYRSTVDLNKFSVLADREKSPIIPFKISTLEINYFDKRSPWVASAWSLLMPGMGQLYCHRLPTGFIVLIWNIMILYFSRGWEAIYYTAIGNFGHATSILNPEWALFFPSLFGFALFDANVKTVEYNKLFDIEQARFLIDNYQDASFEMPV